MDRIIHLEDVLDYEEYEKPLFCDVCGKSLTYVGLGEYECGNCGHIQYDAYGTVRVYLDSHPGSTILKVEKATGVPARVINALIRDGKFDLKGGASLRRRE